MISRENTLSEIWLAAIEKQEAPLSEALTKARLTPQEGANLWATFFRQGWLNGLDLLHQHQVPGSNTLHDIAMGQVDNLLHVYHWTHENLGWSYSDEVIDKMWLNHFFRQQPLPQEESLLNDFPLPSRLWEKAVAKELIDSCQQYSSQESSGWSLMWTQKFHQLPPLTQEQILTLMDEMSENQLYGESRETYQFKRQAFLDTLSKLELDEKLPTVEQSLTKVRI